jgi:predicted DNA-binding protein
MAPQKLVYVSEETHRRLKLLAARRDRTIGHIVGDLVEREVSELANEWILPAGLELQQRVLEQVWADPALDVYDKD